MSPRKNQSSCDQAIEGFAGTRSGRSARQGDGIVDARIYVPREVDRPMMETYLTHAASAHVMAVWVSSVQNLSKMFLDIFCCGFFKMLLNTKDIIRYLKISREYQENSRDIKSMERKLKLLAVMSSGQDE